MSPASIILGGIVAAALAALRWPLVGLLAYLWMDCMRPLDMYPALRSVRPMMLVGVVTLAVTARREGWQGLQAWRALCPAAALAAAVAASIAVSVDPARSVAVLSDVLKMLVLVWMCERLVRSEPSVRAVLWVIGLSCAVLALGAIDSARALDLWREFTPQRVIEGPAGLGDGALRDNNDLARMLVLSVPLWWSLAALRAAPWIRWLAAAALVLSIAGIESTFSRGGFLALLIGTAVVALSYRPLWRGAALWLAFVAALLACSPRTYLARLETILHAGTDQSFQGRVGVWEDAWRMVQQRPLLGQGAGTFRVGENGQPDARRAAHNIVVEVAAEIGLVGLAAYGWLWFETLRRLARLRRLAAQASWIATAAVGIEAALLAYLTASMALNGAFRSPLFVLIGLSLALERCADEAIRQPVGVEGPVAQLGLTAADTYSSA